jgi:hypothetical protein
MIFNIDNNNLCPLCLRNGYAVRFELTESMLLVCKMCSRAYVVKYNGKRQISDELDFI